MVVDYRRSLLGEVPEDYLLGRTLGGDLLLGVDVGTQAGQRRMCSVSLILVVGLAECAREATAENFRLNLEVQVHALNNLGVLAHDALMTPGRRRHPGGRGHLR